MFRAHDLDPGDDYPDFVILLGQAVAAWPRTLAPIYLDCRSLPLINTLYNEISDMIFFPYMQSGLSQVPYKTGLPDVKRVHFPLTPCKTLHNSRIVPF
jgi:hypothetical protein